MTKIAPNLAPNVTKHLHVGGALAHKTRVHLCCCGAFVWRCKNVDTCMSVDTHTHTHNQLARRRTKFPHKSTNTRHMKLHCTHCTTDIQFSPTHTTQVKRFRLSITYWEKPTNSRNTRTRAFKHKHNPPIDEHDIARGTSFHAVRVVFVRCRDLSCMEEHGGVRANTQTHAQLINNDHGGC